MRYEYINPLIQFGNVEYDLLINNDNGDTVLRTHKVFAEGADTEAAKDDHAQVVISIYEASLVLPVPDSISPRQIRMALTRAGLRDAVEHAVSVGDQDIRDWWGYSTVFERTNPQVLAMSTALGVSEAQVDDLWRLGHRYDIQNQRSNGRFRNGDDMEGCKLCIRVGRYDCQRTCHDSI